MSGSVPHWCGARHPWLLSAISPEPLDRNAIEAASAPSVLGVILHDEGKACPGWLLALAAWNVRIAFVVVLGAHRLNERGLLRVDAKVQHATLPAFEEG